MAKILNLKERVHQPFRDALARTAGTFTGTLQRQADLFLQTGQNEGQSNLKSGAQLPNDSSFVMLAARVFLNFRNKSGNAANPDITVDINNSAAALAIMNGNAPGDIYDVQRLYYQAAEQIFWTIGSGEKDSLRSVPTWYLPAGGNITGDVGGATDMVHFQNGDATHGAILRIARAITITPRQLIRVNASMVPTPTGGNAAAFGTTFATNGRDMTSVVDSLNAPDLIDKAVVCVIDGLLARDVQ